MYDFTSRYEIKRARRKADSHISKPEVRKAILDRDGHKCRSCGAGDNLQIDHIVSARQAALGAITLDELNEPSNLQVLCRRCNSSKAP